MPRVAEHPALEGFSPTWEKIKSGTTTFLKSVVKGAAITALVAVPLAMVLGVVGGAGGLLGFGAGSAAAGATLGFAKTLMFGAIPGAIIGGVVGATKAISGADEAAEQEAQKRIAMYERREMRDERMAALEMQRAQQAIALAGQARSVGIAPGMIPAGRGMGGREV